MKLVPRLPNLNASDLLRGMLLTLASAGHINDRHKVISITHYRLYKLLLPVPALHSSHLLSSAAPPLPTLILSFCGPVY